MMDKLKEKALKAAERYMELRGMSIIDRRYTRDGLAGGLDIVAEDSGTLVFATVSVASLSDGAGFREDPLSREQAELLSANWLAEHVETQESNVPVRFDRLSLLVVSEDRAMIRHYSNVLGASETVI